MPRININLDVLPVNTPVRFEHEGMGIVVVRSEAGISAFPDACPHAEWRLSDGECANGVLECPGHGWEFKVCTGECVTVPTYRLTPLRVVQTGGGVHIDWEPSACAVEEGRCRQ